MDFELLTRVLRGGQDVRASGLGSTASGEVGVPPGCVDMEADYVVRKTYAKDLCVGIERLIGEYFKHGHNHNRQTYKKKEHIVSPYAETEIILYFWDERDDVAFSGWWFRDSVGGQQMWARHPSFAMTPPSTGWKVPWNGDTMPGLLSVAPPTAAVAAKPTPVTPVGRWRSGDRILVQFFGDDQWHERVLLKKTGMPTDWVCLTHDLAVYTESFSLTRRCTTSADIKDFILCRDPPPPRMQGEHINRFQQHISPTDIHTILDLYTREPNSLTDIQDVLEDTRDVARSSAS